MVAMTLQNFSVALGFDLVDGGLSGGILLELNEERRLRGPRNWQEKHVGVAAARADFFKPNVVIHGAQIGHGNHRFQRLFVGVEMRRSLCEMHFAEIFRQAVFVLVERRGQNGVGELNGFDEFAATAVSEGSDEFFADLFVGNKDFGLAAVVGEVAQMNVHCSYFVVQYAWYSTEIIAKYPHNCIGRALEF